MKKFLAILLLLASFSGCATLTALFTAAGTIGTGYDFYEKWKDCEAEKCYPFSTDTVYRAIKHAANRASEKITKDEPNKKGGYYLEIGEKKKFKIKVESVRANVTRLTIKVNLTGDKTYADLLYHNVDEELNFVRFDSKGRPVTCR